ncbi:acetyl-CoA synthetase-like protein [Dunaliella salina]|uniref:Acetyl-CoA synthetase-like protein n=1 Tax=Dunaliella salina TaxID=3046 RepID=A0ABQ7GP55_DUNSA|nr:acetyl-CoA synthetase-like protein [Dunaliella salina]|eukprot:KAF5836348.1 acetyl-CoA synthetase-like protein [Dunaliella salina]
MVLPSFSTLLQALKEDSSSSNASAPALVLCGASSPAVSRAALHTAVCDTAGRLKEAGIRPGDAVSLAFDNSLEFVVAFLGITYARAIAAPLNAAYKVEEHAFYLEDSNSKLLLLPSQGLPAAQQAALKLGVPVASVRVTLDGNGGVPAIVMKPLQGLTSFPAQGVRPVLDAPQPSDVALFLHTSGTTGRPKGVPLSQLNLASSLANIIATYDLTARDRSYLVMPLFHVHGLMAGLLAPLAAGGAVIFPSAGRFTASTFWQDCCAHGATFYTAVPTIHQVLLARAATDYPRNAPPPLRFIRSCSSALAPATLEKLEATFRVPVLEAYAMTEASHQMCSNPLPSGGPRKPGTVGPAQGGVKVAILDAQNRLLSPGAIGEVCVRGPNVTAGYLNNPKANEEAFAGGWFHTGDQGFLDEQGYVTLTGRIKELINRGGEKVSPLEVDAALLAHPAVAEAVSFGAPDQKYGEVVAAAVVLRPEAAQPQPALQAQHHAALEKAIKEHCGKKLSSFKVPSVIFFSDKLPKTATGKIQRRHMVAAFMGPSAAGPSNPGSNTLKQSLPAASPAASVQGTEEITAGHSGNDSRYSSGCMSFLSINTGLTPVLAARAPYRPTLILNQSWLHALPINNGLVDVKRCACSCMHSHKHRR